jgi:hypothetical protein
MKLLPGKRAVLFLAVAAVMLLPLAANATTFSFYNITNNNPVDAAAGEAQLSMEVLAVGSTGVSFTFYNAKGFTPGTEKAMSITDIYFYDGPLLSSSAPSITDSGDPNFTAPATPPNLPGGAPYGLTDATRIYSADSTNPPPARGVEPFEWVTFTFALATGVDFTDIITALNSGIGNFPNYNFASDLIAGIHVQAFAGGGSESFVNAPVPPSVLLLGSGLLGLGLVGWRRREKKA